MRRTSTERVVQVPGNPRPTKQISSEWICPECDYFEDAEEERE
jgi:rubredoxin